MQRSAIWKSPLLGISSDASGPGRVWRRERARAGPPGLVPTLARFFATFAASRPHLIGTACDVCAKRAICRRPRQSAPSLIYRFSFSSMAMRAEDSCAPVRSRISTPAQSARKRSVTHVGSTVTLLVKAFVGWMEAGVGQRFCVASACLRTLQRWSIQSAPVCHGNIP
jgi:hypothetical protein